MAPIQMGVTTVTTVTLIQTSRFVRFVPFGDSLRVKSCQAFVTPLFPSAQYTHVYSCILSIVIRMSKDFQMRQMQSTQQGRLSGALRSSKLNEDVALSSLTPQKGDFREHGSGRGGHKNGDMTKRQSLLHEFTTYVIHMFTFSEICAPENLLWWNTKWLQAIWVGAAATEKGLRWNLLVYPMIKLQVAFSPVYIMVVQNHLKSSKNTKAKIIIYHGTIMYYLLKILHRRCRFEWCWIWNRSNIWQSVEFSGVAVFWPGEL